jgi:hypothetical protein
MEDIVLGIDCSTSCIGWALFKNKQYLDSGYLLLKDYKDLYDKLDYFRKFLLDLEKKYIEYNIEVAVEEPVKMFMSNKSMAQTISILQRFNGMICAEIYGDLGNKPKLINASSARKLCGIKISKGTKAKEVVLTHIKALGIIPEEKWEYKKTGKFKDYMFDLCDAYVVGYAWYGLE